MQHAFTFTRLRAAHRWVAASLVVATTLAFAAPVGAAANYTIDGLRVTPPIGQFGGVQIGSCAIQSLEGCRIRTFTLTNVGSEPILFGQFDLQSPVSDVSVGGSTCGAGFLPVVEVDGQRYLLLAPGEACEITIGMSPLTVGRVERALVAWYDDPSNPIMIVPLRAVGIAS